MCGIAGILGPLDEHTPQRASRMSSVLHHRGPDGRGTLQQPVGELVLAVIHTRLAIIDCTETGAQPMSDPASGNFVVYNGELYNFQELRSALLSEGVRFAGRSDTEVLLQALTRWGSSCIPRFRGMFAFAFFDRARSTLTLARDPLGIKPLFLANAGENWIFASEVQAVMSSGLVDDNVDQEAIAGLLAYGAIPQPRTYYSRIRSVSAGSYVELCVKGSVVQKQDRAYWRLPAPQRDMSPQDAVALAESAVADSVRSHLISDVPVGVFLSSGLDSTIVSAIAAQASPRIRTFTVGFPESKAADESILAAETARELGTTHTTVQLSAAGALGSVVEWLSVADQPCMDGLNTYVISRAVRDAGVKVALSGQGGDELFGGYASFHDVPRVAPWVRRIRNAAPWTGRLAERFPASLRSRVAVEKVFDTFATDGSLLSVYLQRRRAASNRQMTLLGYPDYAAKAPFLPEMERMRGRLSHEDDVYDVSALELEFYLGSTLLPVGDVSSMASGLELRVPMLDTSLVEAIAGVPGRVRLPSGRADKYLLRRAFGKFLRPQLLRQGKRGFTFPLGEWMTQELRSYCEQFISSLSGSGLVDARGVQQIWDDFLKRPDTRIWSRAWLLCALGSYVYFRSDRRACSIR